MIERTFDIPTPDGASLDRAREQERVVVRRRLGGQNVEGCAGELAAGDGGRDRRGVHDRAARGVHDEGGRASVPVRRGRLERRAGGERDEPDQHERRAEHRVEEELERRVLTLLAAPHTDHEEHGQQHELEEHEEQDQVLGDEGSGHTRLQDEHEDEERLRVAR